MPEPQDPNNPNPESKEKMHSDKAFRKVSDDMHKYKSDLKDALNEIASLKASIEAQEREVKEKNEQYKELYEQERERNAQLQEKMDSMNQNFLNAQKLSSVKEHLGEFKKAEYNKFIDTSKIIIDNEGNVDLTTVENEVNRLKQQYPELLKVRVNSDLPDEEPESGKFTPKQLSEMSPQERSALRKQLISQRETQN